MNNGKAARMDYSDFDGAWMKAMNAAQERLTNNAWGMLDPREAWNLWLETTLDIWRSAINMGCDPLGLIAGWVKVMEKVQERIHGGQPLSVDPFEMFQEWYDATSKPWSRAVEENIASERFLAFAEPGLENYSHLIRTFRRASEAYFKTLQLPTLSDIARVAELVVDLEEKVDTIEETVEQAKEQQSKQGTATMARIADVEQQLNQIQSRVERILALLEKIEVGIDKGPTTSLQ
jgi:polyhydroxyalkanoic acid synthase PhaR subunit